MRILCNLPLECFDDRAALQGIELVTFGPPTRMWIDGEHFAFDVPFDPSTGSWHELRDRLPHGFTPDVVLLWWPDQEPLPQDLDQCPVPVVGVVSDYNLSLPYLTGLAPLFDVLLCDRAGQDLFPRLGFTDVRWFCQYAHKPRFHRLHADAGPRDVDIGFAGNLNPAVQRERAPWVDRLRRLGRHGIRVDVRDDVRGEAYGRFLNRCRIGWNRSIRGEMNLRAFEVPACGALLLQEASNLEVRDFFVPDEECVLYDGHDFEAKVHELLADEPRRRRIAAAGHARVQQHRFGRRVPRLVSLLASSGPGRAVAPPGDAALGRAVAMLTSWASGPAAAAAAVAACRQRPDDPRALNALALATLRWRGSDGAVAALQLWQRAAAIDHGYAPAAVNAATLLAGSDRPGLARAARAEAERRLAAARTFAALDGPTLPLGYAALAVDRSLALQCAIRTADPAHYAMALRQDDAVALDAPAVSCAPA